MGLFIHRFRVLKFSRFPCNMLSLLRTGLKNLDLNCSTRSISTITGHGIQLNNIADNFGAHKVGKRIGRGVGSGKGKTSGRGHKGQKSRAGGAAGRGMGFEGGQTPVYRRLPKRGFTNSLATPMAPLNVDRLQLFIDMQRIDASEPITLKVLRDSGLVGRIKNGVKLLAGGKQHFKTPITIEVSRASDEAIAAVEALGGSIECVHFNRLGLRAHLKPEKFERIPMRARPKPRLMKYYTNFEKRGYLSPEMQWRKQQQIVEE